MNGIYDTRGNPAPLYDTTGTTYFGGADGGTNPVTRPRTDPATLTTVRHVTTGGFRQGNTISTDLASSGGATSVRPLTYQYPATELRVWFKGQAAGVRAALDVAGIRYELTVNGQPVFDVPDGGIITDPLDPDTVWAETGDAGALLVYTPEGQPIYQPKTGTQGATVLAGMQHLTAPADGGQVGNSAAPWAVLGRTRPNAISFIMEGDSGQTLDWARGTAGRNGLAWTDNAVWGIQIYGHEPTGGGMVPTSPWTHCLWAIGSNNTGQAQPGTYQAAIDSMYLHADAGVKVSHSTLGPRSNSTDAWETVEGQTQANREWREEWNAWVRDGSPVDNATSRTWVPPGTMGALRAGQPGHMCALPYFDREKYVGATNGTGNVWGPGKLTSDGRHYSDAGNNLAAQAFDEWLRANVL